MKGAALYRSNGLECGYRYRVTQQQWGPPPQGRQPAQWGPPGAQPQWGQQPGGWNQGGFAPRTQGFGPGNQGFGRPVQPQRGPGQPAYAPFGPAPQRQRNPLKTVLLALIGLTLVALVGLVVANVVGGSNEVAYQNEDYNVPPPDKNPPPLPVPDTYDQAQQAIVANPIYKQQIPTPVRCQVPAVNLQTASDPQLKTHFEDLMACLVRSWQPPVEGSGFKIVRPTVTIYGKKVETKCGTSNVNAFYCGADQQVYYSNLLPDYVPMVRQSKWGADVVMAHEFGHAIQARTAILISAKALGQKSGEKATQLEFSRRLETQADCFSGLFLHSTSLSLGIKQADVADIEETYRAIGDDVLSGKPNVIGDHGQAASRLYWGRVGLGSPQIGNCNTFTADKKLVR
ncbi:hypothetical protein GCM10009841_36410 [Microlunatus panaciterrae]